MPPGLNNDYVAAVVMMMEISSMQLEIMKSEGANCRYFVCRSFFSIFIWCGFGRSKRSHYSALIFSFVCRQNTNLPEKKHQQQKTECDTKMAE